MLGNIMHANSRLLKLNKFSHRKSLEIFKKEKERPEWRGRSNRGADSPCLTLMSATLASAFLANLDSLYEETISSTVLTNGFGR